MTNLFRFRDYYKLTVPTQDVIDSFDDSVVPDGYQRGLSVRFEATHAALYNENNRFYLPAIMENGSPTFVSKRNKPAKVLKHHDSHSDPVGIITDERFIWTVPEELQTNKDVQIMMDSSFPVKKQVAAAKRFMKDGYPFQPGWKGLGYISLGAIIKDEKTISQIQKGLFDAVSTSFEPGSGGVYCSECLQDLRADGLCEHIPGESYEDEDGAKTPCAWIPTQHNYQECSLVVFDGDPLTSIEITDNETSDKKFFTFSNKELENDSREFEFSFKDFKEDAPMAKRKDALSKEEQMIDDILKEFRPDMEDDARGKLVKDIRKSMKDGKFHPDQELAGLNDESTIKNIVEDFETKDQTIDADAVYAEMEKELEEDAKLSTEKRKKLPDSAFCGSNRSFPVNDKAHCTAAKRLIGKYKGPGDKTKIMACINRKCKALGADSADSDIPEVTSDEIQKMELPNCESLKTLEDKEVKSLFNMAEAEVIDRKLTVTRPCAKCADFEDKAKVAVEDKVKVEDELKELKLQLRYLRAELKDQMEDYIQLVDDNVKVRAELTAEKLERLSIISTLSGKSDSLEAAKEILKMSDISEQETVLMDGFDFEKIYKKLNDGMDHTPSGDTVDSPAIPEDKQFQTMFDSLNSSQRKICENVKNFVQDGNDVKARNYYDKMVSMKVIDEKLLPFDMISAEAQDTQAE